MSIKDLFDKRIEKHKKFSTSLEDQSAFTEVESEGNFVLSKAEMGQFEAPLNLKYAGASYARYGSAEKYFIDSYNRVLREYPYDGSRAEIQRYRLDSSPMDNFVFDFEYPRTTGFVKFSAGTWGTRTAVSDGYGAPGTGSLEYIKVVGGPHSNSSGFGGNYSGGNSSLTIQETFSGSNWVQGPKTNQPNVYKHIFQHPSGRKGTREGNLRTDLDNGVTVEFWLRKEGIDTAKTSREVIFDLWNGEALASATATITALSKTAGEANTRRLLITDVEGNSVNFLVDNSISTSTATNIAFGNANSNATQFATNIAAAVNAANTAGTLNITATSSDETVTLSMVTKGQLGNEVADLSGTAVTDSIVTIVGQFSGGIPTGYGRFTLEYNATASASPLRLTLLSGTTGISDKALGSSLTIANTTGTLSNAPAPWKHYAVSVQNSGSNSSATATITALSKTAGEANTRRLLITDVHGSSVNFLIDNSISTSTATSIAFGNANSNATQFAENIAIAVNAANTAGTLRVTATSSDETVTLSMVKQGSASGTADLQGTAVDDSVLTIAGQWTGGRWDGLVLKLYVDGQLDETQELVSKNMNEITGAMIGYLGALRSPPSYTSASWDMRGWGKLSASIDEFRFWKVARTHRDIGRNWWTQVAGGTNTDVSNTELGVYYKFNEGVTLTSSIDSTVLDYSGRVSNGSWHGYTGSVGARNTGSAMTSASFYRKPSDRWGPEKEDPILYSFHNTVQDRLTALRLTGSLYDETNSAALINTIPAWIIDQDGEQNSGKNLNTTLRNTLQLMAAYFDKLWWQISAFNEVAMPDYQKNTEKPFIWHQQRVASRGMAAPQLFIDAEIIEKIYARDEERAFDENLVDLKNLIYQNIYNNLTYIYKSKGNEKAIRNLVHCFGIDDDLIKLNMYADNVTYKLEDNYRAKAITKNYVDFNHTDRTRGTVYQYLSSSNSNTVSYISGSDHTGVYPDLEDYLGATVECEVLFPFQHEESAFVTGAYYERSFLTSSLFGMHTAIPNSDQTNTDTSWANAVGSIGTTDYANFQVYAVRVLKESPNVEFHLTSSGMPGLAIKLTSSFYTNVYDNNKWNFSVRVKPSKYPLSDGVSGSALDDLAYDVHFKGVNTILDHVENEFEVSTSVSNTIGKRFMRANKRLYVGAVHTNFTASATDVQTDVKISSLRYWTKYLDNDTLLNHAIYPNSVGIKRPMETAYLLQQSLTGTYIPNIDTLALNWDFGSVTGSGDASSELVADAKFTVQDVSSGSTSLSTGRYDWLGKIVNQQHSGRGDFFLGNKSYVVDKQYIHAAEQLLPEYVASSDMIQNVTQIDDSLFTRESRIINHFFSIEKSMYQTISQEMVKMFSSIVDFNNVVGQPVDRYRPEYKLLGKYRQRFFENVRNTPSLDRYVDFYKWIDEALSIMIMELIPASANTSDGVMTMVEDHLFERNKYWTKFPTLEMKETDPNAHLFGITEHLYNWKYGHPRPPEHNYAIAELTAQRIMPVHVGLGRTLVVADVAGNSVTFTIDNSISTSTATNIAFSGAGMDATKFAENITAAINAANTAGTLNVTATQDGTKIHLKQDAIELNGGLPSSISGQAISRQSNILPIAIKVERDWNRNAKFQRNSGLWWQHRAERTVHPLTSKNSTIDDHKEKYKREVISHVSASGPTLYSVKDGQVYRGSTYALRRFPKIYREKVDEMRQLKGGVNFHKNKKIDFVNIATLPIGPLHKPTLGAGLPLNVLLTFESEESKLKDLQDIYAPYDYHNPFTKKKRSFGVFHGRDWEQGGSYSNVKSEVALPCNIVSSSMKYGQLRDYNRLTYNRFVTGATITNLHNDVYGEDKEKPLQGPFTETWVGGHQSRHIWLNERRPFGTSATYDISKNGLDSVYTRPENWFILFGDASDDPPAGLIESAGNHGAMAFVGPDYPYPSTTNWYRRTNPKARFYRKNGVGIKRPVNISNILMTASFGTPLDSFTLISLERPSPGGTVGGNYEHNYQVVQSVGRSSNNLWLKLHESAAVPSRVNDANVNDNSLHATTNIHGLFALATGSGVNSIQAPLTGGFGVGHKNRFYNYAESNMQIVSQRRGTNSTNAKNKTIFVNKFSAPGSFEVMSEGYLDIHAGEYSPYNAMPFRNLTVRGSGSGMENSLRMNNHLTGARASRDGLDTWWRRHSAKFGADPIHAKSFINGANLGYLDVPTYFRQFHRNSRNRVEITEDSGHRSAMLARVGTGDKKRYDNAWVRHTIPQNEVNYSWITQSIKTGNTVYGYTSYDGRTTSSYPILDNQITSSDLRCGTASAGTLRGIKVHQDFVGLNTLTRDHVTGAYDGGIQATALIIVNATSPTDGETLTVEDGSGNTPVTFTFANNVDAADGTATVIGVQDVSDLTGLTTAVSRSIEQAILGGTLDMRIGAAVSPRIVLEQNTAGTAGNTIITGSAVFTGEIKPLSFQGGTQPQSNILGMPLVNTERRDRGALLRHRNTKFATVGIAHAGEGHTASPADTFNALMLHRNGPYGHPTFKQIRNHQHAIVRFHNKNKYDRDVMYRASGTIFTTVDGRPNSITYQYTDADGHLTTNTFLEARGDLQVFDNTMFPSSKDKPLLWTLKSQTGQASWSDRYSMKAAFGNDLMMFSNEDINNIYVDQIGNRCTTNLYEDMYGLYVRKPFERFPPDNSLLSLVYSEEIYPSNVNMYTTRVRHRIDYHNAFWRTGRADRVTLGTKQRNSMGNRASQSCWPLDPYDDFATRTTWLSAFPSIDAESAGELQNNYTFVHNIVGTDLLLATTASCRLNYPMMMRSSQSVVTITGIPIAETSSTTATINRWKGDVGKINRSVAIIDGGYSEWQAGELAGYVDTQEVVLGSGTDLAAITASLGKSGVLETSDIDIFVSAASEPWYGRTRGPINENEYYDDFNQDLRAKFKDYSIVPEFRISDHIDFYMNRKDGNFRAQNNKYFDIKGQKSVRPKVPQNSSQSQFYKIYSNSDFMKHFCKIKGDHDEIADANAIKLVCKAAIKLVPYKGFYPAQRIQDIANAFSGAFGDQVKYKGIATADDGGKPFVSSGKVNTRSAFRSVLMPFFSPGIMLNSIKAGMAVDWPMMVHGDRLFKKEYVPASHTGAGEWMLTMASGAVGPYARLSASDNTVNLCAWDIRVPFEALLDPEDYVQGTQFLDHVPHKSASYYGAGVTASCAFAGGDTYKMMTENFLAETVSFWLRDGKLTEIESEPEASLNLNLTSGSLYGARVSMYRSMSKPRSARDWSADKIGAQTFSGSALKAGLPQDPKNQDGLYETMTISSDAFGWGPAVSGRGGGNDHGSLAKATAASYSGALDSLEGYNGAFQPPYYFGEAWADIIFRAPETKAYTIAEIQEKAYIKYWRVDPGPANHGIGAASDSGDPYSGRQYVPNNGNPYAFYAGNNINENVMQLSASANLLNLKSELVVSSTEGSFGDVQQSFGSITRTKSSVWSIQMKWETPHLNFGHKTIRPVDSDHGLTIPVILSESVPRGIWRQFGLIPRNREGIYMDINDIPQSWLENNWYVQSGSNPYTRGAKKGADGINPVLFASTGRSLVGKDNPMKSLVDLLGFDTREKKLGQIKEKKTVREAVVAVPFVECEGTRKFFEIDRRTIDLSMGITSTDPIQDADIIPGDSVTEMVSKMNRYIFPPNMDFLKYADITPFAMYIFEFEYEFDQDDLSYLWQNLAPVRTGNYKAFKASEASVSHKLLNNELMGLSRKETGKSLQDKVQWMVFKVKQRALTDYSALSSDGRIQTETESTVVMGQYGYGAGAGSAAEGGAQAQTLEYQVPVRDNRTDYSYNWPYDFFSFVELVKIESQVLFGGQANTIAGTTGGSTGGGGRAGTFNDATQGLQTGQVTRASRRGTNLSGYSFGTTNRTAMNLLK